MFYYLQEFVLKRYYSEVNFCTKCVTPRNQGDNFCEKCGKDFNSDNSPRPPDEEPLYCTKCGKERHTVEPFCGNCGVRITHSDWKLPSEVSTYTPYSGTNELKKSSIAQLSIVLSFLLVIGASAWFLVNRSSPGTNSQKFEIPLVPPYSPTLDTANSQGDFLIALNSMQYGRWSISQTDYGSSGTLYVSNWPCSLFMASSYQDAVDYFTLKVNIEFYAGQWLKTDDRNWIVNDVSPGGECIRYFANSYGGMISQQQ